jgi:hypothetical protein
MNSQTAIYDPTEQQRPILVAFAKEFENERVRLLTRIYELYGAVSKLKPFPDKTGGGDTPIAENEPMVDFLNRQLGYFTNHIDEVDNIINHLNGII